MNILGLIGGMSWESSALYYRRINTRVREKLGGLHSASLVLYSLDFDHVAALQKDGRWDEAAKALSDAGVALKNAGAQALVICTNTMHKVAKEVEKASGLRLIHIADCTGDAIAGKGISCVGLLGTAFTMEQDFYRTRLEEHFGLKVVVPNAERRAYVHRVIYEELCIGVVSPLSRAGYETIMLELKAQGAQAVILGCTEICLLFEESEFEGMTLFDTTAIHADAAADYVMGDAA